MIHWERHFSRREFLSLGFPFVITGLFSNLLGKFFKKKGMHQVMSKKYVPKYIGLHEKGELRKRGEKLWEMLKA